MAHVLQIALGNAAVVAAAAPLVWAVARFARRPALTHALWLIVLLKLLTPPLWTVPLSVPAGNATHATTPISADEDTATRQSPANFELEADLPSVSVEVPGADVPDARDPLARSTSNAPPANSRPAAARLASLGAMAVPAVEILWIAGSAICLAIGVIRVIRFSRMLRFAIPAAPALQKRADVLARRLGLNSAPSAFFVAGSVCPVLWAIGRRPRVLLPRALWDSFDRDKRDAVLLHEIAHWRRRDHWVRWIEWAATVLYWWHPACWWARRGLREAEEQCCDAWVLWAVPGIFPSYANALLEAVEFVSVRAERAPASSAVPALASGMGQFGHLKRRLTMLKQGDVARALSWGGLAAAMGLGAALLPMAPTLRAAEPAKPEPAAVEEADPNSPGPQVLSRTPDVNQLYVQEVTPNSPGPRVLSVTPHVNRLYVQEAGPTLSRSPGHAEALAKEDGDWEVLADKYTVRADQQDPQTLDEARKQIEKLTRKLEQAEARLRVIESRQTYGAASNKAAKAEAGREYRTAIVDADGKIKRLEVRRFDDRNEFSRDQRLAQIETQLKDLLREVQKMRSQTPRPPEGPGQEVAP